MKIKILVLTLASTVLFACGTKQSKLSGVVEGIDSGKVYLQKFNNKMYNTIDSAVIKNGKFEIVTENLELPELYAVTVNPESGRYMTFLEKGDLSIVLNPDSGYKNTKLTGSPLQDQLIAFYQLDPNNLDISEYIKSNPKSLASAYVLYREYSYRLTPEEIGANVQLLDSTLHNTPYVKTLNELKAIKESVAIGKKAPNFTAETPYGESVSLNELIGNGYLLIDFWASWCPPCRKENPNVVALYDKYKSEGFSILGVSLDDNKNRWEEAIQKDKLDWTQVSDLKGWDCAPAKLYGVRSIPSNFLLDKDGVIVGVNLMGKALEDKLSELYSKK